MSAGSATGNRIEDGTGSGLFCGDMSSCRLQDNLVARIGASKQWTSSRGHGVVVHFHSTATVDGLETADLEGLPVITVVGGVVEGNSS